MTRLLFGLLAVTLLPTSVVEHVLIVADEIPAMEALANQFQARAGLASKIITQAEMPASLDRHRAVVVYIHKELLEGPEKAFLEYARGGGKLILIQHSISSGKRKNREWLPSFSITLPAGKLEDGGYGYYAPASFEMVNLDPGQPITTQGVAYEKKTEFAVSGDAALRLLDAFVVPESEIFLNHQLSGPRTKLLGIKWSDPRSGRTYQQDTGAWMMQVGRGWVFYFIAGHRIEDLNLNPYAQILSKALEFTP